MVLNIRYLDGGATGTDTGDVWPGDEYVKNWLNFLNISAGFIRHWAYLRIVGGNF